MAYIGKEPIVGNFQKCDAITVVNGQAAYTLQVSSTNVVPESANHMLVSLNGILQAPVTSFSVSSSTLTFVSNLATGDVIDFVILLGNVLDLGTPSDGTVTNAKLGTDLISGETDIGGALADADLVLVDDGAGGTLRKSAMSRIKTYVGSGLAVFDQWRLTAHITSETGDITSNLERSDSDGAGYLVGMSESSGIFTFPSTGYYLILAQIGGEAATDSAIWVNTKTTLDNSSYDGAADAYGGGLGGSSSFTGYSQFIFDVTNTTNCKVKFAFDSNAGSSLIYGSTSGNATSFIFIKLGDT